MKQIGKIYGEIINEKFTFATKQYFGGSFVKILEDDKIEDSAELICEIINRGISNKYLTRPDIVKYLDDNMDFQRETIYTYTAKNVGVIKNGKLYYEDINAIPGKNVYPVEAKDLKIVFGIESEQQKIGCLKKMKECCVTINTNRIFNPHLFIVGKTGSGKSYFMKKYLSNISERFWLFAPSDEYNDMPNVASNISNEYILELDVENISYYINLNASEELILRSITFKSDKVYSHSELIEEIYEYYRNKPKKTGGQMTFDFGENEVRELELPAYANSLIGKLKNIRHLKFTKNNKFLQIPKKSALFDMSEYSQLEQECIINFYLFKLLLHCKMSKKENRKKHIIIIEESHNYIPSTKNALSKEIIVRLSREGRKYGISLCFITQRPRFFDQTALSQSGNRIIFALPNPEDVKHVMEEVPFYKPELALRIQGQRTGECIIAGDAYNDILEVEIDV